eukprot:611760-Amphidinium_carterae.1
MKKIFEDLAHGALTRPVDVNRQLSCLQSGDSLSLVVVRGFPMLLCCTDLNSATDLRYIEATKLQNTVLMLALALLNCQSSLPLCGFFWQGVPSVSCTGLG